MPVDFSADDRLLLDACCLLNLYATRRIAEILCAFPAQFAVCTSVVAESLYVLSSAPGEDSEEKEPVDLQPLIASNLLEVLHPQTDDEIASYVDFAAELDDGEAMTCALALHRGAGIASDDQKVLRVIRARAPQVAVCTTTEILKTWAEIAQLGKQDLGRVMRDIQQRGRFVPGKHDPLWVWWRSVLGSP